MAFCNSCGANIAPGTRFCNKCGAAVLASSPVPPPTTAGSPQPVAPAPNSGSGALKAILIIVGVIFLVIILGVTSVAFFAWRVARHAHVRHDGDNVKVETPFGNLETTKDPKEAARTLGVDIYPEAEVLKEGSASMTFGNVHTAALNFETSD